jgi:hypothetical protein
MRKYHPTGWFYFPKYPFIIQAKIYYPKKAISNPKEKFFAPEPPIYYPKILRKNLIPSIH